MSDQFLEEVDEVRVMVFKMLAHAWERGYGSGRDDEAEAKGFRDPDRTPNPYAKVPE